MKPSHLSTPRQLADCTFTVGNPEVPRAVRRGSHASDIVIVIVIVMIGCVVAGLLIAGVI